MRLVYGSGVVSRGEPRRASWCVVGGAWRGEHAARRGGVVGGVWRGSFGWEGDDGGCGLLTLSWRQVHHTVGWGWVGGRAPAERDGAAPSIAVASHRLTHFGRRSACRSASKPVRTIGRCSWFGFGFAVSAAGSGSGSGPVSGSGSGSGSLAPRRHPTAARPPAIAALPI